MAPPQRPRDEQTFDVSERAPTGKLSLRIVLGDRASSYELPDNGEVVLGRDAAADVVIEDRSVSRTHARIRTNASSVSVEDLGSANGTRMGGKSIAPRTPTAMRPGDAIELGDVVVLLQRGTVAPPARKKAALAPLGTSKAMQEVTRLVERIAPGVISALIVGETGVGKELVAEAIHGRSPRAGKPLVRLNCAAVAPSLLESEWFGYERGAFTGAVAAKPGLLETADGGTVMLDEVGELPPSLQAKLLRVLEDRAVLRVGGTRARRIDVRFVAATNRDLDAESARGEFRRDLYFRLNGVTIVIPPLRERRDEVEGLARAFAAEVSESIGRASPPAMSEDAMNRLRAYSWPGNVRELRNVIERAVLVAGNADAITAADLPAAIASPAAPTSGAGADVPPPPSARGSLRDAIADVEKQRVLEALAEAGGNQKRAAELLGISRGTLLARLDAFGIARPRKG